MKQLTFFAVLAIFCVQHILAEEKLPKRSIFNYEGIIVARNNASEDHASTWTISGKLFVDSSGDEMYTMKLNDVKTTILNRETSAHENVTEKEIPVESKAILNPFLLSRCKDGFNISHYPDEPVWSLNMKRSIASIFFLKSDINTNSEERENTIYGNCKVSYVIKRDNLLTIQKDIDHDSCENGSMYRESNVGWNPTAINHRAIHVESFRKYSFDNTEELNSIFSSSEIVYQSMPSVRSKQIILQSQLFKREAIITEFDAIDVTKNTVTSDLVFDFSKEIKGGRDISEAKSPEELTELFLDNYKEFKHNYETYPIQHVTTDANDTLSNMYEALELMDKDILEDLGKTILKKEENLLYYTFMSYLPYLGTDASLKYIKDLVKNGEDYNILLAIKVLAMFPSYAQNTTEEFLAEMEDLMRLDEDQNPQVKYTAILSFASLVSEAYQKGTISSKIANKYVSHYMEQFNSTQDELYAAQMTYLMGLINMANVLDKHSIISIIANPHESHHMRALGTYGFKERLSTEGEEVYKTFWPIVRNTTEHLEVRVAALDLLMYSHLTSEHFKSIVNWYHDELSDPSEQHLSNYLYTTLESLKNDTGYYEYMEHEATEALKTLKPPKSQRAWSTGNYRKAYTDSNSNFGASFQTRIISNPVSNVLNSAMISLDSFAIGVNLGVYTMYIKLAELEDVLLVRFALKEMFKLRSVPKLLELLEQHKFDNKKPGTIHIELVLFRNNKIVFGMHIDEYTIVNYATNPLLQSLLDLMLDYSSVSYPVMDYTSIVSDLGTGILVSKEMAEVASYELINFEKMFRNMATFTDLIEYEFKYRSTWYYSLYTECYNPLIDTSIATYKYIGKELGIHVPYSFNFTDNVFKLKNIPNALNYVEDHIIGTVVDDKEILKKYCSNCSHVVRIPTGQLSDRKIPFNSLGFYLNESVSNTGIYQMNLHLDDPKPSSIIESYIRDNYRSVVKEPETKLMILLYHLYNYDTYLNNELKTLSITSHPMHDEQTEIIFYLDIGGDEISSGKDPILGTVFNLSCAYSTRESKTAKELGFMNFDFKYESISQSVGDAAPHMVVKYDIDYLLYKNESSTHKICLQRNEVYPSRRSDRYSLEPVEETTVETKLYTGIVDYNNKSCVNANGALITETYKATPRQKTLMEAMPEYTNCKLQSHGLKYIPPTDDCFAAHNTISQYDSIDISLLISREVVGIARYYLIPYNRTYESNDLSICVINRTYLHVDLNPHYSESTATNITRPDLDYCYVGEKFDYLAMDPNLIAYNENELRIGLESACYITSNRVRTFTENTIKNYYKNSTGDPIAFIECLDITTHGLTVQRFDNKLVGFTLWSMNNTVVASVENGTMKIELNNEGVTETKILSDTFKIYFLESDVIYISTALVDIFYNMEYITIKIYSGYNSFICGLCAETSHR